MLKVGLTGGIGSGKSTVAKAFQTLGIPVYFADDAAKNIMNESEDVKRQLISIFGNGIYTNGKLNRQQLSSLVFNNPDKLAQLNAIVHPATIKAAEDWMQQQQTPYAIKEAALIFESGSQEHLDYVVGVYAPQALRIQRVMHRDKCSREEVIARMQRQIDEEIKMRLCNFVITNDEQELVMPQILKLHNELKTKN